MSIPILLAALAQAAAPLPATGQWGIQVGNNMCVVTHTFGNGARGTTLALRPWPLGEVADLILVTQFGDDGVSRGSEHLAVDNDAVFDSGYVNVPLNSRGMIVSSYSDGLLKSLARAKSLAVTLDQQRHIELQLPEMQPALDALGACKALLLKNLGIDPAWEADLGTGPKEIGDKSRWFTAEDYPRTSLMLGAQGTTHLLLTIGADGRISKCVNFGNTSNDEMDFAACKLFQARGRYQPARNKRGEPMVSYIYTGINWVIPG